MNDLRSIADIAHASGSLLFGTLVGLESSGLALVQVGKSAEDLVRSVRSIVELSTDNVGSDLVLAHDRSHPESPVILGVIRPAGECGNTQRRLTVESEGETLALSADREITIRCGQASLRLTQAGKIELRGTEIMTRATGANKIKGGSISLN